MTFLSEMDALPSPESGQILLALALVDSWPRIRAVIEAAEKWSEAGDNCWDEEAQLIDAVKQLNAGKA